MPNHFDERWEGPIRGLRLPLIVWNTLRDEGITTLDQLRAVADQLERLPGIGSKMAWVTREELARASTSEGRSSAQIEAPDIR
jgi:DNA-directed RNA polymerase alpha subunit